MFSWLGGGGRSPNLSPRLGTSVGSPTSANRSPSFLAAFASRYDDFDSDDEIEDVHLARHDMAASTTATAAAVLAAKLSPSSMDTSLSSSSSLLSNASNALLSESGEIESVAFSADKARPRSKSISTGIPMSVSSQASTSLGSMIPVTYKTSNLRLSYEYEYRYQQVYLDFFEYFSSDFCDESICSDPQSAVVCCGYLFIPIYDVMSRILNLIAAIAYDNAERQAYHENVELDFLVQRMYQSYHNAGTIQSLIYNAPGGLGNNNVMKLNVYLQMLRNDSTGTAVSYPPLLWRPIWVELRKDGSLCYFDSKSYRITYRPRGCIVLKNFYVQVNRDVYPGKFCFSLVFPNTGSSYLTSSSAVSLLYFLTARNFTEMMQWVQAFRKFSSVDQENLLMMRAEQRIAELERQKVSMVQNADSHTQGKDLRLNYYRYLMQYQSAGGAYRPSLHISSLNSSPSAASSSVSAGTPGGTFPGASSSRPIRGTEGRAYSNTVSSIISPPYTTPAIPPIGEGFYASSRSSASFLVSPGRAAAVRRRKLSKNQGYVSFQSNDAELYLELSGTAEEHSRKAPSLPGYAGSLSVDSTTVPSQYLPQRDSGYYCF